MSAQSAKKKRLGSRRQVASQNKISEADEFHTMDSTFVAQRRIPEENTESFQVVASPDNSQSETQHPRSPELSGHRRKLGSSRRNKGQHVKDLVTESHHDPREEVEEKTRGKETIMTKQMSVAIQSERQEELFQRSEDDMSASHDRYLYTATIPSSEVQNSITTNCAEADLESLIPNSEDLQADLDENETNSKVASDSCKLVETMQQGNEKSETFQSEKMKESARVVGISESTGLSVLSCPTVDQQLIDLSTSREKPEEKLPNVFSVTEKGSKKRDVNTELLKQDGNLQGNYLVSESHVESVVMQFSTTPEITTEKISPRKNTEIDCSIGQATISSPKEQLPTDEEQNELFNLSEVRGAHQSEDAVNKVYEQEIKPAEMHEMDCPSESVIHAATENSEIISGNLTDHTEMSSTHQSLLTVKITDDSTTNQEVSSPDAHPTKENNYEVLEQKNEKPLISGVERVDTALGQVYEIKDHVEDDIKPVEETGQREKEELLSEIEETLQTLQSEIDARLDSQHHQNDTGFNTLGNRRKLGSSRRNRGRRNLKESATESYPRPAEDNVGNTKDYETFETTEMSLTTEMAVQEKSNETMLGGMDKFDTAQPEDASDQVKEDAHVGTLVGTDLHSSSTVDQQTIDQSNFREMPDEELPSVCSGTEKESKERDKDTDLLRQDGNLQTNSLVSESCVKPEDIESSITLDISTDKHNPREHTEPECSVVQAAFSSSNVELSTNEKENENFSLFEVKGTHQSEDVVNKVNEQGVKPTEMQEMRQLHYLSERVTHDATGNSEIISENLLDQTELIVKSTDVSPTIQDILNPDEEQNDHPTEENNTDALEQKNEDYHVHDTMEPLISDIERVDTALGQVYEIEGQVEDDIKPSAEQTGHQEKDGLSSEMEDSKSSLQALQSEINAPFDSQPKQNNTGFNPIGNRRKLGSSRRNKGRQHVRDSVDKSNQDPTQDVVESNSDNEPLETTEMSLTTEKAVQEKSNETMLGGMDKFGTAQPEDGSDQVKEDAYIGTLVDTDLLSTSTDDQQTINQLTLREMPDEELPNVCSVTEKESKERDEDTNLLRQDENLQTNSLVDESHVKSEDIESSITLEITTEKVCPGEHTEKECRAEEAAFSSSKVELSANAKENENFSLFEVKGAHQSEDVVNKVNEQGVKPTEMQEMPQLHYSSESVTHDATGNSEIISENLLDQTELIVKFADVSPTIQDISNPDEKQDEHPTEENNTDALEQKYEDYHVHDTMEPLISDIERVDTALGQVYEMEGQVEDDIKPSADRTGQQEKEGLFSEIEKNESSFQMLPSEINVPFDNQPQDNSESTEEQTNKGFNRIGNRRKLGSSRRNKERQHVKDSVAKSYHEHKDEDVESITDSEAFETAQMLLAINRTSQEELSQGSEHDIMPATHDSSLYSAITPGYSSEIQSSTTTNYPEAELESLITKHENLQKDHDEKETSYFKVEVSDKSVGATLDGMDKSDTLQIQEVRGAHHSEDAVNKVHRQEVKQTQMQEMPQTDYSSKSLIHDATENSNIISGNLTDQTELGDTHRSELIVKSTDVSPTNQDISNPAHKEDEHPTKESNFEALEQKSEGYYLYGTKEPPISNTERVDTALGQVYEIEGQVEDDIKPSADQTGQQEKDGLFSEMEDSESSLQALQSEINAPFDSQPKQNDTGFNPIGNRRKLESSRRNKGRQHVRDPVAKSNQDPTQDVVESNSDHEPLETTEMSLTTEKAVQEKSNETMLGGMDKFDTAQPEDTSDQVKEDAYIGTLVDTDLLSTSTADQQTINQLTLREMPDEELPNVCSVTDKESKERDEDTNLPRQDGNSETNSLVSESSITADIGTEKSCPGEHIEIECSVEQAAFPSSKEELSTNKEQKEHVKLSQVRGALHLEDAVNEVQEEDVKPAQMQEMDHIDNSSGKETESSLQALQSEVNAPLDSQPLDNSQSVKEQTHTGFSHTRNRRKLGSSRRNKGRLHVDDTTKVSFITETVRQEELKEQTELDVKPAGEIRKIRTTVNEEENTDKNLAEGTILSQNVMDNSTTVTTDNTSSSGKEDFVKSNREINDEENKLIIEPENLSQLTGCDTVKMDLIQSSEVSVWEDDSGIQSISYHDDSVMTRLIASDVLEQEEDFQVQNREALSCDNEIIMQQTNDTSETVGDATIKDYHTGAESLMYVHVSGQDMDGEQFEDPKKKDHEAQDFNVSQHKTDTLAPFDIGLEGSVKAEPAVDASEESETSSQQGIHENENENLQGRSKHKRRKMGSTRWTQRNRKPEEKRGETKESDFNTEADVRNLDKVEGVEELSMNPSAEVSQKESAKPSLSPVNKEQQGTKEASTVHEVQSSNTQSTIISDIDDSKEGVVNPVKLVQVADVSDDERNVDVSMEPSQIDDFTATGKHISSVPTGRNSINPLLSANTEDTTNTGITGESSVSLCETTQSTQNDDERPESANIILDQALKSAEVPVVADLEIVQSADRGRAGEEHTSAQASKQELNNTHEGALNKNLEMKNASPNLNSTNRRRKMGSTRRSLLSGTKREDLHQKHEVDDEASEAATHVGDVKTESFSAVIEDELQHHIEDKDSGSEQREETVSETVEYSHTGESQESPVSHGQLVETEHQLTPDDPPAVPSTSPKHDLMSESASGRRRRKMGSHRKSRGHQNYENQTAGGDRITDAQNGRDVRSAIRTTGELREESLGLDKISEADESDKKLSSNISTSKEGERSRPVSEKTPVQHRHDEVRLGQESEKKFSLAGISRGADLRSNAYNVMMVGDSSVGKTSFIKRAQSGKFSLDLPASVGLDSCMWTVVVDGKPVVLQLWDTAGQERFHSITRQIFHKAQAFILMYDITSSQSFSAISYWASCIQEGAPENVTILLVGNKSDCAERQVKTQDAEILAKEYNFAFMECSAATGENVVQSLETVARMLSQKVETREEAMVLHKEPQKKKSSGCC